MSAKFNPYAAYDSFADQFGAKILASIEKSEAPWQKPWAAGAPTSGMPRNGLTGNTYRGSNLVWLSMMRGLYGFSSNEWLTYKQAQEMGGQVRKGEKQVAQVVFWSQVGPRKADQEGKDATGDDQDKRGPSRLVPRFYGVFNRDQIDGLPAPRVIEMPGEQWRHEKADAIIAASGARISHDGMGRAFYRPATDSIHLPEKEAFHSLDGYLATVLHELGHWTGHQSRLNRDLTGSFGSESYAREELRAEIASWMAGERLGIGHDPTQHAAYAKHWAQIVRQDPKEILRACADAEAICRHLGIEPYEQVLAQKSEQERSQGQAQAQQRPVEAVAQLGQAPEQPVAEEAPQERRRSYGRSR